MDGRCFLITASLERRGVRRLLNAAAVIEFSGAAGLRMRGPLAT